MHLNHILKEKVGQRKAQGGLGKLRENERKNIAKKIVLVLLLYNMSSKIVYWSRCFQSADRSLVKISHGYWYSELCIGNRFLAQKGVASNISRGILECQYSLKTRWQPC